MMTMRPSTANNLRMHGGRYQMTFVGDNSSFTLAARTLRFSARTLRPHAAPFAAPFAVPSTLPCTRILIPPLDR